ncbi:unnamed protein product [Scytosiphon promiscuus]
MPNAGKSWTALGIKKHGYSVASGCLACFASVLGKVAFDGDTPFQVKTTASCRERFPEWTLCGAVGLAVQGASLAGMFMVNAVMLSTYLKALQMSGSTVATVTNFATNFLLSGISGRIIFGERLPMLWFCGASLVVSGVMLLTGGGDADEEKAAQARRGVGPSSTNRQTRSEASTDSDRPKRD